MSLDPNIFKTYDIRGIYPSQLDEDAAYFIGAAFSELIGNSEIAIGRDARESCEKLYCALSNGIADRGGTVLNIGMVSTDMLYFAVGSKQLMGGIMITASHNPKDYNGFKFCAENARPISSQTGLTTMLGNIIDGQYGDFARLDGVDASSEDDVLPEWIDHVLGFIDPKKVKPFKIVVDAGNGVAGAVIPSWAEKLPITVIPMFFEPDGEFPNHVPNPLDEKNVQGLQERVLAEKADMGMIFDGDADRVFLVDETGVIVNGTVMTAMIARKLLDRYPGGTVLFNAICGRVVPQTIGKHKGHGVRVRVGHSLIKQRMNELNAIFAGEHSGHYYFKDNYNADSALIAATIVLELLSEANEPLSALRKEFSTHVQSGEINKEVKFPQDIIKEVTKKFNDAPEIDDLDGLTVAYDDWWFNLRGSNTEPLLRLNVEANTKELMEEKRDLILKMIG